MKKLQLIVYSFKKCFCDSTRLCFIKMNPNASLHKKSLKKKVKILCISPNSRPPGAYNLMKNNTYINFRN